MQRKFANLGRQSSLEVFESDVWDYKSVANGMKNEDERIKTTQIKPGFLKYILWIIINKYSRMLGLQARVKMHLR